MMQAALFDIYQKFPVEEYGFWKELNDITYVGRQSAPQLEQNMIDGNIDIILYVIDFSSFAQVDFLTKILSAYTEVTVIVISGEGDYHKIRRAFLMGASDYLLVDDLEKNLKKSLVSLSGRKRSAYFSDKIYDKLNILSSHIFNGGDDVTLLVDDMVEKIYMDWNGDDIACQQVIEKVKLESYKLFVRKKPWLEKFIYKGHYVLDIGFDLKSKEELKSQLIQYYSDIDKLFKKYNVIDVNKTIYTIGKSIINNIDEKVSLDFVAADVYMNKTYISHIFKKMTGISFHDFLLDVKIERAKILLHYPAMTIGDISAMLNFCNTSYFGATFKRYTGYTPTEYRTWIRNNE